MKMKITCAVCTQIPKQSHDDQIEKKKKIQICQVFHPFVILSFWWWPPKPPCLSCYFVFSLKVQILILNVWKKTGKTGTCFTLWRYKLWPSTILKVRRWLQACI